MSPPIIGELYQPLSAFLHIAMRHLDAPSGCFEMLCDNVNDECGSVPAPHAANGDGHVGLAFLFILGNQIVEKSAKAAEKTLRVILRIHVFDDGCIRTCE